MTRLCLPALPMALCLCACDLTVDYVETPPQACPGEDIGPQTVLDVINAGTDDVDATFHVGWYLSDDETWDGSDVLLVGGRDQVAGLPAGDIASVSVNVNTIPAGTALGHQFLLTVVDELDDVDESDENNNVAASPIEIVSCGPSCGDADVPLIEGAFTACEGSPGQVGQTAAAGGVTCEDVCCVLGFSGCSHRASQSGFNACSPSPAATGSCSDVYGATWSSQCICTP